MAAAAITRRNKALADAKAAYDHTVSDANAAYHGARASAAKQVAEELDRALKEAMDAANLDEANRIDTARKAIRATGEWQQGALKPTSPTAVAAIVRGDKTLADARKVFDTAVAGGYAAYCKSEAEAGKRLIDELSTALKSAMKAGDLEDANKIDAVKKIAEGAEAKRRSEEEDARASVVFVCDASASALNKLATLKDQLQKAVAALGPSQSFNIIFLSDGKCVTFDRTQLVTASAESTRNVFRFLDDVTATGTGNPIPGLRLALQLQPQVIYFMTGGDFLNDEGVKDAIERLVHDRKVKINTLGLVERQDADTSFLVFLEQIAKDSGGVYKRVSLDE